MITSLSLDSEALFAAFLHPNKMIQFLILLQYDLLVRRVIAAKSDNLETRYLVRICKSFTILWCSLLLIVIYHNGNLFSRWKVI